MHTLLKTKHVKCVVWDLDHTIWNGVLIEEEVELKEHIVHIIKTLDQRGILQSISSKNDYGLAMQKIKEFGIDQYFIFPQINWGKKSDSISKIALLINIGIDTIAFIDDQIFERDEVQYSFPDVLCIDAEAAVDLLDRPEFNPLVITEDARNRRNTYMNDIQRNEAESNFEGPNEEFLKTLNLKLTLSSAVYEDLERARELTLRTNQLNATGYTYTIEELHTFIESDNYELLIAGLSDIYGSYGKIGLVLIEKQEKVWILKLLLMSCRIISRGIGSIILNQLINLTLDSGVKLKAEFIPTERNRMMYVTYKFAGFSDTQQLGNVNILEYKLNDYKVIPAYIDIDTGI